MLDADKAALYQDDFFARVAGKERRCHIEMLDCYEDSSDGLLIFSYADYWERRKTYFICRYDGNMLMPISKKEVEDAIAVSEDFACFDKVSLREIHLLLFPTRVHFSSAECQAGRDAIPESPDFGLRFLLAFPLSCAGFLLTVLLISATGLLWDRQYLPILRTPLYEAGFPSVLLCVVLFLLMLEGVLLHHYERETVNAVAVGLFPTALCAFIQNVPSLWTWLSLLFLGPFLAISVVECRKRRYSIWRMIEHVRNLIAKMSVLLLLLSLLLHAVLPAALWEQLSHIATF